MNKAITYLLLGLLLFQNSGRLVVLAWFKLHQPEIVRTLCENRDRPDLHCDGTCVLAKKLAAADKQQEAASWERLTEVTVFTAPSLPHFSFVPRLFSVAAPVITPYQSPVSFQVVRAFFHPPCV